MSTIIANRRFPRASVSLPCAVDDPTGRLMRGRLWSATCEGMGIEIAAEEIEPGDELRATFRVMGEALEAPVRVVWQQRDGDLIIVGAALSLGSAPEDVPAVYARWLLDEISRARAEAMRLAASLAARRSLSLRALQDALDLQAISGGSLGAILRSMGVVAADVAAGAAPPAPSDSAIALPGALTEWSHQWTASHG